jgi:hypothetical protein
LIDQRLHKDLDPLETGTQRPDYRDDLLLAIHRSREPIKWQPVRSRLQTKQPLICSRRTNRATNISADPQATSTHTNQSALAAAAAARREIRVIRVYCNAVNVTRSLEVHQRLRFCRSGMKDAAGFSEELQN